MGETVLLVLFELCKEPGCEKLFRIFLTLEPTPLIPNHIIHLDNSNDISFNRDLGQDSRNYLNISPENCLKKV